MKWLSLLFLALCSLWVGAARAGVDPTSQELQYCLQNITDLLSVEAFLEANNSLLHCELDTLIPQIYVYQWYRDNNRTVSGRCLHNLTVCNDDNEFKTATDPKRESALSDRGTDFYQDSDIVLLAYQLTLFPRIRKAEVL